MYEICTLSGPISDIEADTETLPAPSDARGLTHDNVSKGAMRVSKLSRAFTRLKAERPQDMTKIIAVVGDLCLPNLGINVEDEANLLENVSIVFHSAATVKFNAPLREAMRTNVEGTGLVLELSRRMKKLEVTDYGLFVKPKY
ncbi:hypothetical protein MSG28_006543 [Choristoneura fumiferana]|uniref:Uncharacterized protein n=1 Tax=Choristoneura fumiferana TaxID=7141 RepID=A0ACC0JF80_CHOFU|nr:hypothetical protein MSG28_006543 [Choristoneura fumiferana]